LCEDNNIIAKEVRRENKSQFLIHWLVRQGGKDMRKRLIPIYSILAIAIVLLVALAPSCGGPTTGTIVVQATRCGVPWQGAVNYTLTGPGPSINGTTVQSTHGTLAPGTWTCAYVAGGPAGAFLNSIQPSATQSLTKGGTITFTLNFELNQDAAISFLWWSVNGHELQGSLTELGVCNVTDVHFQQWVNGCTGYNVTLNETDWLTITASPANPPGPVFIYVVNADCALNKTPTPQGLPSVKKSQVPSINNATVLVGDNLTLMPGMFGTLDAHTVWQLVKGTNYTKSINWLGISKAPFEPLLPPHPCVLFELVVPAPGLYQFTLVASAHVDLVGSTDVNPGNNDAVSISPLTLNVNVLP
jgi:hypothetical protein